ncbi:MAG: aspartate--tRNA ligase [Clostridia bacterium]|nr:aspartate--tRNA ligase [Clostridia bacterium]
MSEGISGFKRNFACGELRAEDCGKEAVLMGWVQRRRDHGGLIFVDLRDRSGIVQVVFSPELIGDDFSLAEAVRNEFVLAVKGTVRPRPEGTVNPKMATGEIDVYASELRILNKAKTPPFYIEDNLSVDENVRLKYRYLDLRRNELQQCLALRHKVTMAMRRYLDSIGFWEIETPMLGRSTPEGARDYLVPSRIYPGCFFALPQSPQIYKQLLMVAGMEKYFQIARCFRDEDLRADRQPEFTQLDMEMSFVERENVLQMTEGLMGAIFKEAQNIELPTAFPRLTWQQAMERFGSDKPDTRFGMEIIDIADIAKESNFKVFASVAEKGGWVRGINAKGCAKYSRKEIDDLTSFVAIYGAKGLAWIMVEEDGVKSAIAKFFTEDQLKAICNKMQAQPGDLLLFVADKFSVAADSLGHLRCEIAKKENLIDPDLLNFLWVTEFPLLEYDDEEKRYVAVHHPFTSPMDEDIEYLESDPGRVRAKAYDLVLNGTELGGGSIRIHNRDVQNKMFKMLGFTEEEAYEQFGFMLDAFEYGTPPHGGIAFGLDRMIMLMARRDSIRDVIAFPKTQSSSDMMNKAPGTVYEKQLRELHIKIRESK